MAEVREPGGLRNFGSFIASLWNGLESKMSTTASVLFWFAGSYFRNAHPTLAAHAPSVAISEFLNARHPDLVYDALWPAAAICLFFAFYRAWSAKNREIFDLRRKFEPGIKAKIFGVTWGFDPDSGTVAIVKLQIKNLGSPTTIELYSITIDSITGLFLGQNILPNPGDRFELVRPEGPSAVKYEDCISPKTAIKPIATGSQIGGILIATFEKVDPFEVERSKVVVRFRDIYDQEHSVIHDIKDTKYSRRNAVFPGVDSPADT